MNWKLRKKIGRGRNLSRFQMISLSNKTVKEPVEHRHFKSRNHGILMSLEIYQGTV
jgi:hypothetical protein